MNNKESTMFDPVCPCCMGMFFASGEWAGATLSHDPVDGYMAWSCLQCQYGTPVDWDLSVNRFLKLLEDEVHVVLNG